MNYQDVKEKFDEKSKNLLIRRAKHESHKEMIERMKEEVVETLEEFELLQDSVQFLNDIANSRRGNMKGKIESIITEAVQLIYGSDLSVSMEYKTKNNRSHLDFKLIKKTANGDVSRNMSGFGGGVADAISVPLRLLVLLGSKQTERVCVLDECYKHVSKERIQNVAEFLKDISDKLGVQLIMSTHADEIKKIADRNIELENVNGAVRVV